MEIRVTLWVIVLCAIVGCWFYANSSLQIDYEHHTQLVDPDTGVKHKPSELIDLAKITKPSPEYINSTNAVERLYDLVYLSTFENPFTIDQSYSNKQDSLVSGWPVANQARCSSQLDWILDQLHRHAEGNYSSLRGRLGYDLTRFMDSFGRPESGLFSGSIHWLGSYKNCLAASLDGDRIKTRYCIARMRFKSWPQKENIYPAARIRVGVCLPETCDTLSYETSKREIDLLAAFNLPERLKNDLEADSLFCLPDERSPLRQIPTTGRIYLVIMGAWFLTVFAATVVYENNIRPRELARSQKFKSSALLRDSETLSGQKGSRVSMKVPTVSSNEHGFTMIERIICAFSIRNSIKAFTTNPYHVDYDGGQLVRLNIGIQNFLKVIMMLVIVLISHAGWLTSSYMRSLGKRVELNTEEVALVSVTMLRSTDVFFVIFGGLKTYNMLVKLSERQLSNPLTWLAVNVLVLIRVAPLFMIVYWYSKLISPYTGSGPWWDYGIDKATLKTACINEPWWKAIPYFGCAGFPGVPTCNMPSWFIVSYTQLSLLMPLMTYIICKLPRGRLARGSFVGFLLLASASIIALRLSLQTSLREEGITLYGGFAIELLDKFELTSHVLTLGRLGAAAVGCLLGYLVRQYATMQIVVWPRWLTSKLANLAWIVVLLTLFVLPVIRHRIYLHTGSMITWTEFIGFNVLVILLLPVTTAILSLVCTCVYNNMVWARFLSHSFWHSLNKLTLCIFLIHWEIFYIVITGFEQGPTYGFKLDVMKLWAFGVVFSILLALVIHILIEVPLSSLLMILLRCLVPSRLESSSPAPLEHQATSLEITPLGVDKCSTS